MTDPKKVRHHRAANYRRLIRELRGHMLSNEQLYAMIGVSSTAMLGYRRALNSFGLIFIAKQTKQGKGYSPLFSSNCTPEQEEAFIAHVLQARDVESECKPLNDEPETDFDEPSRIVRSKAVQTGVERPWYLQILFGKDGMATV
jgi:hypothetical protein